MRAFGTEISANRGRNDELSVSARAAILSAFKNHVPQTKIARDFSVSRKTVYRTIERFENTNSLESRPRSGGPKKLSPRDERHIVRIARKQPKLTYAKLKEELEVPVSTKTIYRVLKKHNLTDRIATNDPKPSNNG